MVHHKGVQDSLKFEVADVVRPPDATHCLRCGYHNLLGISQETIKEKVKGVIVPVVNGVLAPMGWCYLGVGVFGDYFEIYYKEASPVEPVTTGTCITILTLICVLVVMFVIAWVAWVFLETQKIYAKTVADKKKLLEEGKITSEQFTQLVEAQKPEDVLGGLGDILPLLLVFIIIMVIAGAVGKVTGKD